MTSITLHYGADRSEDSKGVVANSRLATSSPKSVGSAVRLAIKPGRVRQAIERVNRYIDGALSEPLTLEILGQVACMSTCHFSRVFKQEMGVSVTYYIKLRRVEEACRLLDETGESLTRIALSVGYSYSHFIQAFRDVTGVTPKGYRRRQKQASDRQPG